MKNIRFSLSQVIGFVGACVCLAIFIKEPSFPTPDKLVVFLTFVFMIFKQAKIMLKRLLPFIVLLLVYESFRGLIPDLNKHVNYTFAPNFDKAVFGSLPTQTLQGWLWHGHVSWYDYVLYAPYLLFFIIPLGLAILVWKTRDEYYWRVVTTYLTVFFGGFLTFLLFPAAPPWMAAQYGYIEPIRRISSDVWFSLGIKDFPSLYSHISPNPVAAVPSLHSACATLLSIFVFKIYGKKWGLISLLYPASIYIGVVYEGEHYVLDVILGALYAFAGYYAVKKLYPRGEKFVQDKTIQKFLNKSAPVIPKAFKNKTNNH